MNGTDTSKDKPTNGTAESKDKPANGTDASKDKAAKPSGATPGKKPVPDAMNLGGSAGDTIKPKPAKPEDEKITRQKEDEDKKKREIREKKAKGESVLDPKDPKAINRKIIQEALDMTKADLNKDGVW